MEPVDKSVDSVNNFLYTVVNLLLRKPYARGLFMKN